MTTKKSTRFSLLKGFSFILGIAGLMLFAIGLMGDVDDDLTISIFIIEKLKLCLLSLIPMAASVAIYFATIKLQKKAEAKAKAEARARARRRAKFDARIRARRYEKSQTH